MGCAVSCHVMGWPPLVGPLMRGSSRPVQHSTSPRTPPNCSTPQPHPPSGGVPHTYAQHTSTSPPPTHTHTPTHTCTAHLNLTPGGVTPPHTHTHMHSTAHLNLTTCTAHLNLTPLQAPPPPAHMHTHACTCTAHLNLTPFQGPPTGSASCPLTCAPPPNPLDAPSPVPPPLST